MENNKHLVNNGLMIEYFSTAWMAFEFIVGFISGLQAHSILLIAFGLDSFLEIISGSALIWRLKKEMNGDDSQSIMKAEKRSSLIVGSVLILLSVYIVVISLYNLFTHQASDNSLSGLLISVASVILMPILTILKRKMGKALHSNALVEDGMCNITCAYMAGTVLLGTLLTYLLNWWWADSVAALILVYFIFSEGLESFQEGRK
ncbi:membrane protein [Philodulcilactobacillus myokoensis]|uniref:Membrane protein n=1 Tax=Philodulcilactobacillus myokoensis TaxID=2929573 RepID=A0A9W6AZW1_9LACO|nr:cation transporter [Philodulcilactobacillus myokoensis]GLB46390.1 membrane protein [Philodulcilactobacillus myokoensis]